MNYFDLRKTSIPNFSIGASVCFARSVIRCFFIESGVIYCWGANTHGQCGVPGPRIACSDSIEKHKAITEPRAVKLLNTNIKSIHCGWSSVIVLTGNTAMKFRSNLLQQICCVP